MNAWVEQLEHRFRDQVKRALGVELDDSETALAFADHYLTFAREGQDGGLPGPVAELLATGMGAFFGELVRRKIGATWVGEKNNPRRLRLLIEPAFLYFSPVDLAFEVIFGGDLTQDDARLPANLPLDPSYHLDARPKAPGEPSDADWMAEQLQNASPVTQTEYHTLTCRFETLTWMVDLLVTRDLARGSTPRTHGLNDYVAALSDPVI